MTETKITCDRCKKPLNNDSLITKLKRKFKKLHVDQSYEGLNVGGKEIDLCDGCTKEFEEFLGQRLPAHGIVKCDEAIKDKHDEVDNESFEIVEMGTGEIINEKIECPICKTQIDRSYFINSSDKLVMDNYSCTHCGYSYAFHYGTKHEYIDFHNASVNWLCEAEEAWNKIKIREENNK